MTLIQPFRGLRPAPGRAGEVIAPPYDVLSSAEARDRAAGRPWSFLHVSKPEIDLPENTDPYDDAVYAKAAENLAKMIEEGVLVRDAAPCYYVYRVTRGAHSQTGLAAAASLAYYATNRIRKHEFTTPVKEDDRVRQIEAIKAQTGPVMMAYPDAPEIDALIAEITAEAAEVDVEADDGVRHALWTVTDADRIAQLTDAFEALPALYIADGHHRSAAAARVSANRGGPESAANGAGHGHFLSVIFPHQQMQILDYNRVVKDLNGHTGAELIEAVSGAFTVEPSDGPVRPDAPATFGMYLEGRWHKLTVPAAEIPADDALARLDISLLTARLIEPLLGISDPRRDTRIAFVGGIRGLEELERRVDSGEMAVAFALYPTRMEDLMAVADAGEVMPPKSTWFEPKLADGMVSHVLD